MFPSQWKTVQVHCIHKNGSTQDWKLQSNFTYKYTKQVIRKYYCFFWTNKLVTTPQWGFRKGRSFELLLLSMTEKWRFVLDERESIGIGNLYWLPKGVWFCVSSNFASGLCGDSLDWIVNYLKNLHQFVSINGTISLTMGLTSGVPKVPCWAQDFSASLQMTCLCPLSQR